MILVTKGFRVVCSYLLLLAVITLLGCGHSVRKDAEQFQDRVSLQELGFDRFSSWSINRTLKSTNPHAASVEFCVVEHKVVGLLSQCDLSGRESEAIQLDYSNLTVSLLAEPAKVVPGPRTIRGNPEETYWPCLQGLISSSNRDEGSYNICASSFSIEASAIIADYIGGSLIMMFGSRGRQVAVDFRKLAAFISESNVLQEGTRIIEKRLALASPEDLSLADREKVQLAVSVNSYMDLPESLVARNRDVINTERRLIYQHEFASAHTFEELTTFISKYRHSDPDNLVPEAEVRLSELADQRSREREREPIAVRARGTEVCRLFLGRDGVGNEHEVLIRGVTEDSIQDRLLLRVSSVQELNFDRSKAYTLDQADYGGQILRTGTLFWDAANNWKTQCL